MKILTAEWLLPVSAAPIKNGAVAFERDKIIAVGALAELEEKFPGVDTENFGEAAIMPGFVNAHSHLELTAMRGFLDRYDDDFSAWLLLLSKTRAEKLTDLDIETAACWGALEGARAGVTCFADIGRFGAAGLCALKANGLRGVVFQETEFAPKDETARDDFARLEAKFLALKDEETHLVKAGISPHAPYTVSRRLYEIIADYAIARNVKISTHAAESAAEDEFMRTGAGFFKGVYEKYNFEWTAPGVSSIEYLSQIGVLKTRPLLAHCVKAGEKDIELIGESGSSIAHCPKSNAKFGHGVAPFESFLDKKLKIGIGSDSVASNNVCDLLEEARFAAFFARVRDGRKRLVEPREAVETATIGGARALGLDAEIGSLEAGKQADFAVVSLESVAQNPVHDVYSALLFASAARDVRLTAVAGEEIYRDGAALKVDERELKIKIKRMAEKMNQS